MPQTVGTLTLLSLPIELLQHIAVHAKTTGDALSLARTSRVLYDAIGRVPTVFQTRVKEAGWDLRLWEEEARDLTHIQVIRLWQEADHSCVVARSMLSEAKKSRYFERSDGHAFQVWYPKHTFTNWGNPMSDCAEEGSFLPSVQEGVMRLLDGESVWAFLSKFVRPFNLSLTHHDSQNLGNIISLANPELWRAILRTLSGMANSTILSVQPVPLPCDTYPGLSSDLASIQHNAVQFERFTSTFAYFILLCDLADLESIFGNHRQEIWHAYIARAGTNNTVRSMHERLCGPTLATVDNYADAVLASRRFSALFVCITAFCLDLRLLPSAGDRLSAPLLPSPHDMRTWTANLPRHSLEGTPFAHIQQTGQQLDWCGYYGYYNGMGGSRRDPPMFVTLAVTLLDAESFALFGEGQDNIGSFSLSLRVVKATGMFDGIKSYTETLIRWDWRGCLTPIGAIGRWGDFHHGGPIWLWPRDWSES